MGEKRYMSLYFLFHFFLRAYEKLRIMNDKFWRILVTQRHPRPYFILQTPLSYMKVFKLELLRLFGNWASFSYVPVVIIFFFFTRPVFLLMTPPTTFTLLINVVRYDRAVISTRNFSRISKSVVRMYA